MRLKTIIKACSVIGLALLLSAAGPGGCSWGDDSLPPDPPPPAPLNNEIQDAGASQDAGDGCGQRCRIASRDIYQQCIDSNRPEEACRELAGGWTRECIAERCNGGNDADAGPQDDGCDQRCRIASRDIYQECIDSNRPAEACRERALLWTRQCIADRCNGGNDADAGPRDDACENRCAIGSRNAYQECIDNNGSEEDCRRRAAEYNQQCLSDNCGGGRGGDDDCENHCDIGTRNAYQECIDNNGSVEDCRRRAGEYNEQCMRHCGDDQGGDDACENRCDVGTRNAYQECIDNNGSVEDCRRRAGEFREQCMRRCGERDGRTPCGEILCERGQRCVRNQCVDG